jgi:riboflavin synthase
VAGHSRRQAPEEDAVFTGIVEELGEVVGIDSDGSGARIRIRGPAVTAGAARGDSIAINGVCLTVTGTAGGEFTADVMAETLARSSLGSLRPGSAVNLERPLRPDGRLGGHIVQGHVDGTGTIVARQPAGSSETVRISVPPQLARYLIEKGSVAVDGISLTISALGAGSAGSEFEVSLIPETLARTTLGRKQPGEVVNLEVDVIAKYVESLLAPRGDSGGRPPGEPLRGDSGGRPPGEPLTAQQPGSA